MVNLWSVSPEVTKLSEVSVADSCALIFPKGGPLPGPVLVYLDPGASGYPSAYPRITLPAARSQWQTMETQDGPFHVPCAAGSQWQASVFELNNVALILDKKLKRKATYHIYIIHPL